MKRVNRVQKKSRIRDATPEEGKKVERLSFREVDAETFIAAYNKHPEKMPLCEVCEKRPATRALPRGPVFPGHDPGYINVCDGCNPYKAEEPRE